MSVSELEQRLMPLTMSQPVWQPWGPAGPYRMDEEDAADGADVIQGDSNIRRTHSWGGYATHAQRSSFGSDDGAAPAPAEGSGGPPEGTDESDGFTDEDSASSACETSSLEQLEAAALDGQIMDDGQTWVSPGLLEDPDGQRGDAWRALSAVQMWFQHGNPPDFDGFESSQFRLRHVELDAQSVSESEDSTYLSESGSAPYSSEGTEVGHWSAPEEEEEEEEEEETRSAIGEESDGGRHGAEQLAKCSSSGGATETPVVMPRIPGAAGSDELPAGERQSKRNRRGKKSAKARREKSTQLVTTLMVQNLPFALSREELLDAIHRSGYADLYNFCHLPRTFKTGKNQGFAFVNFLSPEAAHRFTKDWHGNRSFLNLSGSCRPLRIKVAKCQGIEACERIAQSTKMQKVKMDAFKPLVIRRAATDGSDSTAAA